MLLSPSKKDILWQVRITNNLEIKAEIKKNGLYTAIIQPRNIPFPFLLKIREADLGKKNEDVYAVISDNSNTLNHLSPELAKKIIFFIAAGGKPEKGNIADYIIYSAISPNIHLSKNKSLFIRVPIRDSDILSGCYSLYCAVSGLLNLNETLLKALEEKEEEEE